MKRKIMVLIALLAGACQTQESLNPPPKASVAALTVATANNALGLDLYRQLKTESGNIFFSPFSLSSSLAMTYRGARGETAAEMAKVLHWAASEQELDRGFAALNQALLDTNQKKGIELSQANALWAQKDGSFLPSFLENLKTNYGAEGEMLDFKSDPERARQRINSWSQGRTHDRIKGLLLPGNISSLTRLILTNVLYFKGQWRNKFDPLQTATGKFHTLPGNKVEVPLMHQVALFRMVKDQKCQALELNYVGGQFAMLILLPFSDAGSTSDSDNAPATIKTDLQKLEASLTPEYIRSLLESMSEREVSVTLPKWCMTGAINLSAPLEDLGMKRAFLKGEADFSGINGSKDLYLAEVRQGIFVEVNEEGTEAAAVTHSMIMKLAAPPEFIADRPFVFLIIHRSSGAILFAGRMADPTKTGGK